MIPQYYEFINIYESKDSPALTHVSDNSLSWFFRRYFMQDVLSIFKWNGIPDNWDKDYFLYTLMMTGRVAVIKTDKFGVIPQFCTLYGRNIYYLPSTAKIVNPLFSREIDALIDVDCALIKMQPDYGGAWDLVEYYACATALACEALGVNLINSKLAYVFAAENKQMAESFKKLFDQIASGQPASVVDKKLFDDEGHLRMEIFNQNVKNTFIADQVQGVIQQFRAEFHTKIGIPNVNIAKASGVGAAEVNANNVEATSLAQLWLDTIKHGIGVSNKLFNTNLSVELRFKPEEGGFDDAENRNNVNSGAI